MSILKKLLPGGFGVVREMAWTGAVVALLITVGNTVLNNPAVVGGWLSAGWVIVSSLASSIWGQFAGSGVGFALIVVGSALLAAVLRTSWRSKRFALAARRSRRRLEAAINLFVERIDQDLSIAEPMDEVGKRLPKMLAANRMLPRDEQREWDGWAQDQLIKVSRARVDARNRLDQPAAPSSGADPEPASGQ